MSEKITWRALDEASKARTEANWQAFPPQTLAFTAPTFFWPCNLSQERYNFLESVPKKEIPARILRLLPGARPAEQEKSR